MKSIIVHEYLAALKEDKELDYIFPLLLLSMDFRIISKPEEYKGYSQFGKDVIAIGLDPEDGIEKIFYFEIKGGDDKNLTSSTFNKDDGIRESLQEAKDAIYKDPSIPKLSFLARKVILVHNGVIKPNVRDQFNGFIKKEFRQKRQSYIARIFNNVQETNPEFARWDINRLTELFEEYLFNEYLLTDDQALRFFKGFLSLFCTPEYDNRHFYELINHLLPEDGTEYTNADSRSVKALFETFRLIGFITINIAKDNNNLLPALRLLHFMSLRMWSEILLKNWVKNKKIIKLFDKNYELFRALLEEFYTKTIEVAKLPKGLYFDDGGRFGVIGSPMLSFEYLGYLNIHLSHNPKKKKECIQDIIDVINNNTSCYRPLLDGHSCSIMKTILNMIHLGRADDARKYIASVLDYLSSWREHVGLVPEGRNQIDNLLIFYGLGFKPISYENKTSQLIGSLFDIMAKLEMEKEYEKYRDSFMDLDLCVFVPYSENEYSNYREGDYLSEVRLFQKGLYHEGYQSEVFLDETFKEFMKKTTSKDEMEIDLVTLSSNYPELVFMAQFAYQTPIFPMQWRGINAEPLDPA